ncbi:phosphopantetheine-binding protein [Oceanospirillum sp. HFRX-1_2]
MTTLELKDEQKIFEDNIRELILSQPLGENLISKGFDTSTSFSEAGLDSMDLVTAIVDIEEEFDIDIPLESIQKLNSIDDVINLIFNLKKK